MLYAVLPKVDWDHETEIYEHPGCIIIHERMISQRVDELSGRTSVLSYPSIRRKLREGRRVYIQGRRPATLGSLLVQRVPQK